MDNIERALTAVDGGFVRHCHPFTWECAAEAQDVDARTLQRALQQQLVRVETNADRGSRPVTLTAAGLARIGRDATWTRGDD